MMLIICKMHFKNTIRVLHRTLTVAEYDVLEFFQKFIPHLFSSLEKGQGRNVRKMTGTVQSPALCHL